MITCEEKESISSFDNYDVSTLLENTEALFKQRCASARDVVEFLEKHPEVEEVFHPSSPRHVDSQIAKSQYKLHGSLLSFRLKNAVDEHQVSHFCNVLAATTLFRYALSFDGLVSKVNHHTTVSEFFTPPGKLRSLNIDRLVRLAIGTEDSQDLKRALTWALDNWQKISISDAEAFADQRAARFQDNSKRVRG